MDKATLYFITGADAILEILTWKSSEEIIGLCKFIAATRPGYDIKRIEDLKKELFGNLENASRQHFFNGNPCPCNFIY